MQYEIMNTELKMKPELTEQPVILNSSDKDFVSAMTELERGVCRALKTYSNVERGSGHYSVLTTKLLKKARNIILEKLKLDKNNYVVIFCSPFGLEILKKEFSPESYKVISSRDIGLSLGVRALAVNRNTIPGGIPSITGGGMIKLVSKNSLVLADIPERFEAGTPGVMNIIAFAKALQLTGNYHEYIFKDQTEKYNVNITEEILNEDDFLRYTGKKLLVALKESMVDRNIKIPALNGVQKYINLDNAASTPVLSPVWDTVCKTWRQPDYIRQNIISKVREVCSGFLNAPLSEYEVLFCSNTTEAINIAADNLKHGFSNDSQPVILNTVLEHHSNELPWRFLSGTKLVRLAADAEGFINLHNLESVLKEYNLEHRHGNQRIRLVAVSGASNVLGSYNDIGTMAKIAHKYNARILVDAAQLIAHHKISMAADEIDFLAFSGHKMYAPFGSGALIARKSMLNFDSDELNRIKAWGEENAVGIAAIGKAINLLQRIGMDVIREEENYLTKYILESFSSIPEIKVFGVHDTESPGFKNKGGIIVFKVKGIPHNLASLELAEKGGIGVRTGCFCAHLITKQLMKIHPVRGFAAEVFLRIFPRFRTDILPGVIRVSLGVENDKKDIDHLIRTLKEMISTRRSFIHRFIASVNNGTPFLPYNTIQKEIKIFCKSAIHEVYR